MACRLQTKTGSVEILITSGFICDRGREGTDISLLTLLDRQPAVLSSLIAPECVETPVGGGRDPLPKPVKVIRWL